MRPPLALNKCKLVGNLRQGDGTTAEQLPNDNCKNNPDLAAVVDAWPELPEAIKAGIVAMVRAASGSQPDRGAKGIGYEEAEV